MANILVIRFSALGDVAMTVPVLFSFARHYPQHRITVLSRAGMEGLFRQSPPNLFFYGVDLKEDCKGIGGLSRLFGRLQEEHFDAVADLHDVLRSKYLRWRFCLRGTTVAHIDKGRKERRRLTAFPKPVPLTPLPSSFQRYAEVFRKLGYVFPVEFRSIFENGMPDEPASLRELAGKKGDTRWIGIAPFAAHAGKIYPAPQMEEVIRLLSEGGNKRIFLFGGGAAERMKLEEWAGRYPGVVSVAGKLDMEAELLLMSRLNVMLSMDSGNMHLASLAGTPVISVWGATHPYAGFMGWGQPDTNAVQADLPCRPCSIFGNRPCRRGDYACLREITPQRIIAKVESV